MNSKEMRKMKIIRNHIEEESFKIIDDLMGNPKLDPEEKEIRSRITHAAGDVGLYWKVDISKKAVDASEDALRSKCNIITDSRMVEAGIRKKWLTQNGNKYFQTVKTAGQAIRNEWETEITKEQLIELFNDDYVGKICSLFDIRDKEQKENLKKEIKILIMVESEPKKYHSRFEECMEC